MPRVAREDFSDALRKAIGDPPRQIRLQKVVRQGHSPMNPKVRWAQLECGHDVYISPGKRIPKVMSCEKCTAELNRTD